MPGIDKYAGGEYYGTQNTWYGQPQPKVMTLGAAMNQDVAGWSGAVDASGVLGASAAKSAAGNFPTPSYFSGVDSTGNAVSINPAMPANYVPEGTQTSEAPAAGGGAGGMLGAGSLALGGLQTIGGLIGLLTTKEPAKYGLTNDNKTAIAESKTAARYGLAPTQTSAFMQNVRQAANTDMYNARNLAGSSLSRSVFGLRRGQTLGELNRLAVSDFNAMQEKTRYRNQMFGKEQEVKDRNTALDWNQYGQKMQAYGGALQSGLNNMAGFFNLGEALKYTSLMG